MPVEFLTDEQAQRYGQYAEEPTPAQLARYFYLDDQDQALVAQRRRDYNRLGFALHLCTVRFLGTFLVDLTAVPAGVVRHLAVQLAIEDISILVHYRAGRARWGHAAEIKQHYGYRDFHDPLEQWRLLRWLYSRCWLSNERPTLLFDFTTAHLVERKVLLPGVTVLVRLVAQVRERVAQRLWRILARLPSAEQRAHLEQLLIVPEGKRHSTLERLRRSPTRASAPALVSALRRVEEIRALGVSHLDITAIPPSRLQALARYAATAWASTLARLSDERRIATLLAFAVTYEARAQDDVLDTLTALLRGMLAQAIQRGQAERLRTLHDLDQAAWRLQLAVTVLLDADVQDVAVRETAFGRVSRALLAQAVGQVQALTHPDDDRYYEQLLTRYTYVRQFLPLLLQTIHFHGTKAGQPVLEAVTYLKQIEGQRHPTLRDAPTDVVNRAWHPLVFQRRHHVADRRAYTFCSLERLHDALQRREIFISPSERWSDPRRKLLQPETWQALRAQLCRTLNHSLDVEEELATLAHQLDAAYQRTAKNLLTNSAVRIEQHDGQAVPVLTALTKLPDPPSLVTLRQQVEALLPRVELPDLIWEVLRWTGFDKTFTHVSEAQAQVKELALSLCAVLISEACNIGLEPLIDEATPTLSRGRLLWVQQNYIRAETLTRANARLVEAQTQIELAQQWGGGEVASADGLRFVVPMRTLHAGPNRKYFNAERGITYYNFTSDQFTGFHAIVIPGTLRDSLYVLDGLLEQQTVLEPTELMTDTAGYSDIIFGLFWLLGYQFSPRLADLGRARYWRMNHDTDYGALEGVARHRINQNLIRRNWDDLLRVAGSLKMGTVSASEFMRTLRPGSRPSTLARAIGEVGRAAKTRFLLAYLDDESYRRRILTQLNRSETRHTLARAIFHGQRGEVRQRYREGQEDQLGALGLVLNMVILWNTRYMDAALTHLRNQGIDVHDEDVVRLSPLRFKQINLLGRYHFKLNEQPALGELRPLRTTARALEML